MQQSSEAIRLNDTVHVTVKLFATFRVGRFSVESREYAAGTPISEVIGELGIPDRQIGMIMLNHRHAEADHLLCDGDTLSLFPLVGGG